MRDLVKKLVVEDNLLIKDVLKIMHTNKVPIIICLSKKKVTGVFTEGDFRKAIFAAKDLGKSIKTIMNKKFVYLKNKYNDKKVEKLFLNPLTNFIPILSKGSLDDVIFKTEYLKERKLKSEKASNPIIIMAGGKGTRLDPFTRILPKPLLPIDDKSILEILIEKFKNYGFFNFYMTVGFKSNMIRAYLKNIKKKIKIIQERKPLGSVGSLYFFKKKIKEDFFVSNCDVIVNANYNEVLQFHKLNKFHLTIVGSIKDFKIPYGVCKINKSGYLKSYLEKPNYSHIVNTGLYILNQKVLEIIPNNHFLDMDELIKKIIKNKLKIGVFPINSKNWLDFGQWDEYNYSVKEFGK